MDLARRSPPIRLVHGSFRENHHGACACIDLLSPAGFCCASPFYFTSQKQSRTYPSLASEVSRSQKFLLEVIRGQRHGILPMVTRGFLWAATPLYRMVVTIRNRKYDFALRQISDDQATGRGNSPQQDAIVNRVGVPVISIGNLTTGGTGKTPMVIWVCSQILSTGKRVAILSRGYGAPVNDQNLPTRNDEALELDQRLPNVPHLQDADRVRSANIAVEELETECLVLDDGFQHRRIARDLDVVLIDATCPFGYGYVLPRGLLREPVGSLRRADVVVITRCELADADAVESIAKRIAAVAPEVTLCRARTRPTGWLQHNGTLAPIDVAAEVPVLVCCAIGNPESFIRTAQTCGVRIVGEILFPDHHLFSRDDMEAIVAKARSVDATRVICTHKDLVKLGVNAYQGVPFFALQIDIEFEHGEQTLVQRLNEAIG